MISGDYKRKGAPAAFIPSQPVAACDDSEMQVWVGEGMGGSSRINALLYTRGATADYNNWLNMGNKGWGFSDLLPLFIKSEKSLSHPSSEHRGSRGLWMNKKFYTSPFKTYQASVFYIIHFPDSNVS
jgi:choline dehydrogenase